MTKPEALRLADKYEAEGFLRDHRFAQDEWCRQAALELRRLHERGIQADAQIKELLQVIEDLERAAELLSQRIAEIEGQFESIGAGGVEQLRRRDHFRGATEMVHVGWAISYDGKNPHALWTAGEGDLLDLEVKRQGGTACKMELYARVEK